MMEIAVQSPDAPCVCQEPARGAGRRCQASMLIGEIEERLKPNLKGVQVWKLAGPLDVQACGDFAEDSAGLVILAGPRHLSQIPPADRPLQQQSILCGCEYPCGACSIPPTHQRVSAPLVRYSRHLQNRAGSILANRKHPAGLGRYERAVWLDIPHL
jgi:hypothetical protein